MSQWEERKIHNCLSRSGQHDGSRGRLSAISTCWSEDAQLAPTIAPQMSADKGWRQAARLKGKEPMQVKTKPSWLAATFLMEGLGCAVDGQRGFD